MIRIVIVDDHPALRMGLEAALEDEPGFICVAAVQDEHELLEVLAASAADVVLLDYRLPGSDGLHVCRRIKALQPSVHVLIVSAFADEQLALSAAVAGADGVVSKTLHAQEIRDAVRAAARGATVRRPLSAETIHGAGRRIDPEDLPLLGMLLEGTSQAEVEEVLAIDDRTYRQRVDRMLARLSPAQGSISPRRMA